MALERNSHSVLAKLMGIDRLSSSHASNGRQRVLSEKYHQGIASVAHRERSALDLYVEDFSMDVDGRSESQAALEVSEGRVNQYETNSSVKNKLQKARFSPQDQRFEVFGGFDLRGRTNSCSQLDKLTVPGSSHLSAGRSLESGNAQVQQKKSFHYIKTGSFTPSISKHCIEVENHNYSPSKRIITELNKKNEKSHSPGKSFSSPISLCGDREETRYSVRSKGISPQRRRTKSLGNGIKSPIQGSCSPQEIAKQITSQVKHSVWHSYTDVSILGSRSDGNSVDEREESMTSSSCLFESENKHEESSFKSSTESASQEPRENKKQLLERRRKQKCFQEMRTSHGREFRNETFVHNVNCSTTSRGNENGWQVGAARYLSSPTLFPSAWVPRSRKRDFILDRSWSARRKARGSMISKDSMADKFGHEVLQSTSKCSGLTLDSENCYTSQEASPNPKGSVKLEDQVVSEETFTAREFFSDQSDFSDVESLTYHEACMSPNMKGGKHLEKQVSGEASLAPLSLNCRFGPVSMNYEQVAPSTCVLLEDRGSNFQDFKYQLKDASSFEPGSPVSSLEGPEACMRHPNLIVESEDIPSFPVCLENEAHGLQTELHPLEAVSLDSGSEGTGMMVSSAEGDEGVSVGCYWEDAQIMEIYGTSNFRDVFYVYDVLAESGFPVGSLEMESETWRSRGYALNPSVFKLLEEKYGKQAMWERSERRLLFDRINSELMEVAQPFVGINIWRKPVAKRFSLRRGLEIIEDELWDALINQEEELRKGSSDKLCRREIEWLELEEDTSLIAQEIECSLIEELIEEFVNMETFEGMFM